jgi:uncharacterized small protein (DUF1192 family)
MCCANAKDRRNSQKQQRGGNDLSFCAWRQEPRKQAANQPETTKADAQQKGSGQSAAEAFFCRASLPALSPRPQARINQKGLAQTC